MYENPKTKKRKPFGVAFRMLSLMVVFILFIFSLIFVSFNFFIDEYVQRDMENQLSNAIEDINQNKYVIIANTPHIQINNTIIVDPAVVYGALVRYLKNKNANSEVNAIIYSSSDYGRRYPNSENDMLLNLNEMDNLLHAIKENNYADEKTIYKALAAFGNYYLTVLDLDPLFGLTGFSAVFYVSSAKYDNFVENIYVMLLFILLIAMIFTILYVLLISQSISKPIKKLCVFADEIGHGNFRRNEYSFKDRELVDLNRRMNETAEKLEKNDENQKTFFQNVSHELKTPLMSIRGYAEGVKYGVFETQKDKNNAADIIISESERLNELVSDLLYISKIDNTNNPVLAKDVNLAELSENCAGKLRGLVVNHDKTIKIIPPPKEIYIDCNEENLMRAVMNIMANGVRYAKTNVEVSFRESGQSVFLHVKDDGPGIPEKELPDIFKRFYKGPSGKHGIGLSIAKSIAEQHNAKITAKNRLDGPGAEFIIEFAAARPANISR
ncbi:MAG: HAMP domain-containing histidine kinase [Oscillospiraceae bacterium]|nr:HAMP domain-containing histidine kinase [Oscillospiraceae bacterium]